MHTYTEFMREEAGSGDMSAEEAVEKLCREVKIRTLPEVLARACGLSEDDKKSLKKSLVDRLMETTPDANRDSVDRNVRNWLNQGKEVSKESAIQLCFALKLPYRDAEDLLYRLCGEGFHWRDPSDIVYLYSLLHGQTFTHAKKLYDSLKEKNLLKTPKNEQKEVLTGEVRMNIETIRSDEELETFFRENISLLGKMHNTAYSIMMDFLSLLRQPEKDDRLQMQGTADAKAFLDRVKEEERNRKPQYDDYYNYREEEHCDREVHFSSSEKMTSRDILSTYLYDKIVSRTTPAGTDEKQIVEFSFELITNEIRKVWPEETTFSKIVNREIDVTRKLLILLFLATDGEKPDQEYDYDELELTPQEIIEDRNSRLDTMLIECGFSPLDPRAPFDWMILYCICAEDILEIDDRLHMFLMMLFPQPDHNKKQK